MKVTLHTDHSGKLMIYVPKKDLEEEVIEQTWIADSCTFTLANGWELEVTEYVDNLKNAILKRLQCVV